MRGERLDLTRIHYKRAHGDITVYATWYDFDELGWRPVLVLAPTDERTFGRIMPYVIPLDQAYLWSVEAGDPSHTARGAFICAEGLNLDTGHMTLMRIVSIVQSHLGTLLTIPPRPTFDPGVVGYAHLREDGQRTEIKEILSDV